MALGFFQFGIYFIYSMALLLATRIVANKWDNSAFDRNYTVGDVLSILFGILTGIFSLMTLGPSLNSFFEAR